MSAPAYSHTHPASVAQRLAAEPDRSTWLSANAGSGKTKVLTDRVARLLLSGTEPQRILCLTYTKAAAAEMQNRLFRRLGEWAMMAEPDLRAALSALGLPQAPDEQTIAAARRLFARAIETPGGLKIQTIHSFCASLLRRFPLEAQVAPGFVEMDDRSAELLRAEIIDDMAERLAPEVIGHLASLYTGEDFLSLAKDVSGHRALYAKANIADLPGLLDVQAGDSLQSLLADVFEGDEAQWMPKLIEGLLKSSAKDQSAAAKLAAVNFKNPSHRDLVVLEGALLTGAKTKSPFSPKIGALPTRAGRAIIGDLAEPLEALMERVAEARPRRIGVSALEKALALHRFAAVFLPEYERRKLLRGWLDFDDLILRARDLLSESSVAQWVLYRLDGGIDHILVDEAQDTGPEQWRVIETLAQEFTSGQGARDNPRTIFVVGDKKQSIYSFQGADLEKFEAMRQDFSARLAALGSELRTLPLEYSFRSSPAVLAAVDATCAPFESLGVVKHIGFKTDLAGRVDLWPALLPEDQPDPGEWWDPVDLPAPRAPDVVLAETIAKQITDLLAAGTRLPTADGQGRPMRAGDVLILVQRRQRLFHEVIRACKAAGLPIAGADRLKLGAETAVKDLAALLSFLSTQEDDLSLAVALRSPLFGWSEEMLYDLAQGREGYLWSALRSRKDHAATVDILLDLRNRADYLRPFELIDRVLTRHDGRRRLIARLGAEAEDGIDQFLAQALAYERMDVPSLTGFLTWLQTDDVEVKRQADAAGDRIRVMTVHGSKGLEAPVVILPDTGDRPFRSRGDTILIEEEVPVWQTSAAESPASIAAAKAEAGRRWAEENQRLLYVAMTRAETWLIVAAAGKAESDEAWHKAIGDGLVGLGAQELETPTGTGLRYELGQWPANGEVEKAVSEVLPELPDWAKRPASQPTRPPRALKPSDLGGAKALGGEAGLAEEDAMLRGTALHLLLERLPEHPAADWPRVAGALGVTEDPTILEEATRVLQAAHLAPLFAPDALAEVDIRASYQGLVIQGVIDRLVVTPDYILAVDFKSNATVPRSLAEVPEGLLRQMGAYAHALGQVYPGRMLKLALLWTREASLMELPMDLLADAFARSDFEAVPTGPEPTTEALFAESLGLDP